MVGRGLRGRMERRRHPVFRFFEGLVDPYPEATPVTPPRGFFAFLWACSKGVRGFLLATTLLTAVIGAFEALLFGMLGGIVDWLSKVQPAQLWAQEGQRLLLLGAVLAGSIVLVALQSMIKQQTLFGNFPMLLRWNFHRLMLGQSMSFYQDEFAGRIATKVMQTSLAVRDTWLIVSELLVFVIIYFVTLLAVLGNFDARLLVPFLGWVALYILALYYFVPRLGRSGSRHRDGPSPERHLALGDVGDGHPLRAHRHGAGRDQHHRASAHGGGCARCEAARRHPRGYPL